jgi:hydroxyproline transporter system substrate-binding protein
MTVPYFAFQMVVLTRADSGINSYADLKNHPVGNTSGTYEAIALEKDVKAWGGGSFRAYQSLNDTILAVTQGHIDATVVTNTVAAATLKSGKYKGLKIAGDAPYTIDYVSLAAKRNEYGLLNYMNLFVNQQVRTGRYQELWDTWVGKEIAPANLSVPGVYY